MRNKGKRMVYVFIYIGVLLLFQEVVFRLCFPLPELSNFNRMNYQVILKEGGTVNYLSNENKTWESSPDTNYRFVHELNDYGFRDRSWPIEKTSGKKRMFVLGDSFVEGVMCQQEESVPAILQQRLGENWEVFNAGILGVGFSAYLQVLQDAVPIFKPDEVLLVLFSNDIGKQWKVPDTTFIPRYRIYWKPRLLELLQRLNRGEALSFRWKRASSPFLRAVPDKGNPFTDKAYFLEEHVQPKLQKVMKQGRYSYFRINWLFQEEQNLKEERSLFNGLHHLKKLLDQHEVKLTLFYVPSRSQISTSYYQYDKASCRVLCSDTLDLTTAAYQVHAKQLQKDCAALNISFHDLTKELREKEAVQNLFWNYDDHMKAGGYAFLAQLLYEKWRIVEK
jgi:hypothetical protein